MTEQELDEAFQVADEDGDGSISYEGRTTVMSIAVTELLLYAYV